MCSVVVEVLEMWLQYHMPTPHYSSHSPITLPTHPPPSQLTHHPPHSPPPSQLTHHPPHSPTTLPTHPPPSPLTHHPSHSPTTLPTHLPPSPLIPPPFPLIPLPSRLTHMSALVVMDFPEYRLTISGERYARVVNLEICSSHSLAPRISGCIVFTVQLP